VFPLESNEIVAFLGKHPEYSKSLRLAVEHEVKNQREHYLGWEWYDVEIHPTKLIRLVTDGIAKVNFKSRSATCYLLKDRGAVKRALDSTSAR